MKCPYCDREDFTVLHTFRLGLFKAVKAKCNYCGLDSTHLESQLLTSMANTILHKGKKTEAKTLKSAAPSPAAPINNEPRITQKQLEEVQTESIRKQQEQKTEARRILQGQQAEELRIKQKREEAARIKRDREAALKRLLLEKNKATSAKTVESSKTTNQNVYIPVQKQETNPTARIIKVDKPKEQIFNPDTLATVEPIDWNEILSDYGIKTPPAFMPALPLIYNVTSQAETTSEKKAPTIVRPLRDGQISSPSPKQPAIIYNPSTKSSVSVNIGFDWGASTTKVVYSFVKGGKPEDPKVLRFDSYFRCEDKSNYLPLSVIVRYQDKLFILPNADNPGIDFFTKEYIKASIINSTQQGKRTLTNEVYALFSISSLLAYVISEIKQEVNRIFHGSELKTIKIRFGTPVETVHTDLARVFKRLFATAINIYDKYDYFSGYGVSYADMLNELKNRSNRESREGWDFDIIPEAFAALSSFVVSKQMKTDYFAIVDIGSCTMDLSFYLGSEINKTLFAQRTATVTMLGATNCERYIKHITAGKQTSIEWADEKLEAAFCNSLSDFAKRSCHTIWEEDNPKDDVSIPYYIFGGGSLNPLLVKKVKKYMEYGSKQYTKSKTLKYEMTYGLFNPDKKRPLQQEDLTLRLQVAYGLVDESAARIPKLY